MGASGVSNWASNTRARPMSARGFGLGVVGIAVGTGNDGDGVLAAVVYADNGNAGRSVGVDRNMLGRDAVSLEAADDDGHDRSLLADGAPGGGSPQVPAVTCSRRTTCSRSCRWFRASSSGPWRDNLPPNTREPALLESDGDAQSRAERNAGEQIAATAEVTVLELAAFRRLALTDFVGGITAILRMQVSSPHRRRKRGTTGGSIKITSLLLR